MLNLLVFVFAKHRTFLFWSGLKLYESKGVQQDSSKAQTARCSPIEIFLFLNFIDPLISGYFLFFCWSCAAMETLSMLLPHGSRMSSSMYNQVSFLGFFLPPYFWSLAFFFRSHAASETLRKLLAHGTHMSSSIL
jgi:hypothetical protein